MERQNEELRHRHPENRPSGSNGIQENQQNGAVNDPPPPPPILFGPSLPPTRYRNGRRNASRATIAYMVICTFYVFITLFIHMRMNSYPVAKQIANSHGFEFCEESARGFLKTFLKFGPRVSGSEANYKAEEFIVRQLRHIQWYSLKMYSIDVDIQRVSGSFTLDFINVGLGEFTSVYQNLTNVVVKFSPPSKPKNSLLVNCHYDTVVDSPGAGDDATSCAVMLEIIRALSRNPHLNLSHNIIFLFNGAEENILQTSHGFITQHEWASDIKAFVNLDSAGAGGWELVFQTGPEHPWLIKTYIESAPYPHASCIGQEIFQTGMIPSDTDYRIFRDFGHIPGIDIAHIKNGYVYHTRNDNEEMIPEGCLQRGGENVMALVMKLASSPKLSNPGEDRHGAMVFFDFVGFFTVAYPQRMALILNWAVVSFVYLSLIKKLYRDSEPWKMLRLTLMGIVCHLVSWSMLVSISLGMAEILSLTDRQLSYYTHNLNIVWLFMMPSVSMVIAVNYVFRMTIFKDLDTTDLLFILHESCLLLWSMVLAVMTCAGLMSSFVPLLCVLGPILTCPLLKLLGFKQDNVLFTLLGSLVPSVYAVYLAYTLFIFLVPIMGRRGMEVNPDFLVSLLACVPTIICVPYHISFVYTHKHVRRLLSTLGAVSVLALVAVLITPAGFPYSGHDSSHQRAMVVHTTRRFHNFPAVHKSPDHIWYLPIDFHGQWHLREKHPNLLSSARQVNCDGVYCGRPFIYPMLTMADPQKTLMFPASAVVVSNHVSVNLTKKYFLSDTKIRLSLALTGPSHVTIFINERDKVKILSWNFGSGHPVKVFTLPHMEKPTYFIYYSHSGDTTWHFDMDIQVPKDYSLEFALINIGFVGHYFHGPHQVSSDLKAFERALPEWISPVTWTATYDEWTF